MGKNVLRVVVVVVMVVVEFAKNGRVVDKGVRRVARGESETRPATLA